jgi:phage-related protein
MDVWGAVWGFLQPIISAIVTFVVEQFGWIITWFTENWPLISQTVATVINFISETISTGLAIIQAIWSAVWPVLSDVILPIWEAIKTVISTTIETIAGIIKAVMQAINGNWSGAWNTIKSIASNLISGMLSAIGSLLSGLWVIIKSPFELAWQCLMDMADTFMDVGAAIVDGIKNGISNAWGAFKTWMKNKIGNVVEWAKEILGIDSPSKAFANVGKFIPPGLAEGIDSTMKVAVSATKNMAKKVIDAGSNIALEIPSLLSPVPALAGVPAIMSPEALGGYGRPVGSAGRSSVVYNIGDVTVDAKDFGGVRSIEEFAEMLRRKKRQAGGE